MRDYIFRGKRVNNGEWVEGGIIPLDPDSGYIFIAEPYLSASTLPVYEIVKHHMHLVIPESVGQYTEMNDIGGHRIFEGDIMETAIGGLTYHRGVVEFTDGSFGLRCTDGSAYFLCFVAGNYAIIGNVFENADLLEG